MPDDKNKPVPQTLQLDEEAPQTLQLDEEAGGTPTSDEEISNPGGTERQRQMIKSGKAPAAFSKPTKFEQENQMPENYGFTPGHIVSSVGKGLGNVYDFGKELIGDINNEKKPLLFGNSETEGPEESIAHKYLIRPSEEQNKEAQRGDIGSLESVGHSVAAGLPVIGPWVAGHAKQAGTGDVGGAVGETIGEMAGGKAAEHVMAHPIETAKVPLNIADKVVRGTPLTEAGKLEAAQKQALAVKKPSMTETEYAQKVNDAMPDLQKIAQDNKGKIKTPRQAVQAINDRISQIEAPIADHLNTPEAQKVTLHPDQYVQDISSAIDQELAKRPGSYKPAEIEKAKKSVMDFIGDQEKNGTELEGNRKRLNQDADAYYNTDTAGKRAIDVSDATAVAQRAAANKIRDILYGDNQKPGFLENAGVTAVDANGQQVPLRALRQQVGRLIDVRDHFEDAITKAEATGDWKAFDKWRSGPSLAAGGLGLVAGGAVGGPFGAVLGTLAGEGVKAWADYLKSKNANLNVQKMFRNLADTSKPNTAEVQTRAPIRQYPQPVGPQVAQHTTPAGPELPAAWASGEKGPVPEQPFEVPAGQPNRTGLWQPQVGAIPDLSWEGLPAKHEPLPLNKDWAMGRMGVKDMPPALPAPKPQLPMPGAAELAHPEMFPQEPIGRVPERTVQRGAGGKMQRVYMGTSEPLGVGQTAEGGTIPEMRPPLEASQKAAGLTPKETPEKVGGAGREGVIGRMDTVPAAKLKVGDTFIDETGDARRVEDVEGNKIKTKDGDEKTYTDEINLKGELNSPESQGKIGARRGGVKGGTEEEEHKSFGVHPDDLPRRAKYADVDFDSPDLQDTAKKVTADSIKKDYVRPSDRGKVSVYQSYIPMEDLPTPKFVDEGEEDFDRSDYHPKVGSPIKVDIHKNGSVNILDGNHRVKVWDEQGQEYAPAWVVDHRGPNIEHLSEDEIREREEEAESAKEEAEKKNPEVGPPETIDVVRRGHIGEDGAYFSSAGQSTYFDPESEGVEKYQIKNAKIADTDKPEVRKAILKEALKDDRLTDEERSRINELISDDAPITYMENDELPLPDAAKKLGYHGIKVWENDDISHPSSIFLWDTSKAEPAGENVYRAHDVGNPKVDLNAHAHATESKAEAHTYKQGREEVREKPQMVSRINMARFGPNDVDVTEGPNGKKWYKFKRQLTREDYLP